MKDSRSSIGEADLHAFVDGESPPERRHEIESFLGRDPRQAARVEMWRRQNDIIRATFARVAGEPLPLSLSLTPHTTTRLEAVARVPLPPQPGDPIRIDGHAAPGTQPGRRAQRKRLLLVATAAFLAGGIVAFGSATLIERQNGQLIPVRMVGTAHILAPVILRQGPPGPEEDFVGSQLAARAIEAHRTYVPDPLHPVDMAASQGGALADWLSHRVGIAIDPPDLTSEGLQLLGGRVTPGERGPAGFLIYTDTSGNRIGLYITPMPARMSLAMRYQPGRSVSAAAWISNGAGYALTGAADRDQLLDMARRAQSELAATTKP